MRRSMRLVLAKEERKLKKLWKRGESKQEAALRNKVVAAHTCYESTERKAARERARQALLFALAEYYKHCGWTFKPYDKNGYPKSMWRRVPRKRVTEVTA